MKLCVVLGWLLAKLYSSLWNNNFKTIQNGSIFKQMALDLNRGLSSLLDDNCKPSEIYWRIPDVYWEACFWKKNYKIAELFKEGRSSIQYENEPDRLKTVSRSEMVCPVGWSRRIYRLQLCKGVRPTPNKCPGYDTKQSDYELPVMLELWAIRSTPSLPLFPYLQ